ncbi:hypothetical protein TBLA_0D02020 [Henningerozyma blattae CBS 6284]|uniref:Calcineurin-like phosphoesterase domain-containing protein n=1 Tax=Henningerozyma blattae (strain ATCC 34711 / CBS 6284 / DSM 70876 / NBRC 10599 / NRRL Y-10934 / UCD 77-7) TaxID=1071380 RepID=I2H2V7_HENB6|nr:hypothetical protein TBLA_0D02020 [Tetrapisispora blattae CBS 6284]CCH60709.1 hypothetical protein TBLA_0D02020 [Tetrapisispora blattae CBS 6284]
MFRFRLPYQVLVSKRYLRTLLNILLIVLGVLVVYATHQKIIFRHELPIEFTFDENYFRHYYESFPEQKQFDYFAGDNDYYDNYYKLNNMVPPGNVILNIGIQDCTNVFNLNMFCTNKDSLASILSSEDSLNTVANYTARTVLRPDISVDSRYFSRYVYFDSIPLETLLQLEVPELQIPLLQNAPDESSTINWLGIIFRHTTLQSLLSSDQPLATHAYQHGLISNADVLFGHDAVEPRPNYALQGVIANGSDSLPAWLSLQIFSPPQRLSHQDGPRLTTDPANHKFKIVQLADLHLSTGYGVCRDPFPANLIADDGSCHADPLTLQFVSQVLDEEQPQLVVFSGDQIMGDRCKADSKTALLKAVAPVIQRGIPWAMIWGNHDDEGSMDRIEISEFAAALPGSQFQFTPFDTSDNTFGVGNYLLNVYDTQDVTQVTPAFTLYFLDSHKYATTGRFSAGYDWVKPKQLHYFQYQHDQLPPTEPQHISMAFLHIPVPEYRNLQSNRPETRGELNPFVGNHKEPVTAPARDSGTLSMLQQLGISVVSCGHDHCNDYCLEDDSTGSDVWLCYGGAAGEGGYSGYGGTERRIRIYELDAKAGRVVTWKRRRGSMNEARDYQVLVDRETESDLHVPEVPDFPRAPQASDMQ